MGSRINYFGSDPALCSCLIEIAEILIRTWLSGPMNGGFRIAGDDFFPGSKYELSNSSGVGVLVVDCHPYLLSRRDLQFRGIHAVILE